VKARKLGLILVLAGSLAGCFDPGCRNQIVQNVVAPGGSRRAIVFQRDCGATTGFSTQISITAGEGVAGGGNVFVADGGSMPSSWRGPWAAVEWRSPDRLLVRYDRSARLFVRRDKVAGVKVDFEAVSRRR
jgi:hypothetical protein